jgi:hypothetical protein
VKWESSLYANLEGDLSDNERLADSVARTSDDDALEHLNTAAVTLHDVYVDLYGVTCAKLR